MSIAGAIHRGPDIALSVVVPCYNEEAVIDELVGRLTATCGALFAGRYEIVLVNDGSADRTWELICDHVEASPAIVGIDLSRNHGHQLALTAGLNQARGELVLVIDADLQDPPELLPQMLDKLADGYDVVYGRRIERHGESRFKRATAAGFYRLLDRLIDIPIPRDTGDFRLMTRRVVDQLNAMPERYRFIRGMVSWVGFNQTGIAYERDPRFAGESHYSLRQMLGLAFDGITSFSTLPLRLASHLGLAFGAAGIAALGWVLLSYLRRGTVTGWASLIAVILILGSVQLMILGVIGEYLGRMYLEAKQRPLFIIREIRGRDRHATAAVNEQTLAG
jgi:dolichol-phosphate mannosyltransferase